MHFDVNHQVREEIFTCVSENCGNFDLYVLDVTVIALTCITVSDYLCGNFDLYVIDVTVIALTSMFQTISVETLTCMF